MPANVTMLGVFISGPSDVEDEKKAAEATITEANQLLRDFSIIMQPVSASDVPSGRGIDAQDVINKGLPDYDIYLGIMGERVGTPTNRAQSGTIEEFESAIAIAQGDSSKEVMFYFRKAMIDPETLDLEEFQKVKNFRKSVSDEGIYFKTFDGVDSFKRSVLQGLVQKAKELGTGSGRPEPKQTPASAPPTSDPAETEASPESEEDDGYLDVMADLEVAIDAAAQSMNNIGESVKVLGEKFVENTAALEELQKNAPRGQISPAKARRLVNQLADELVRFARRTETELPNYRESWATALDKYAQILASGDDGDWPDEIKDQREDQMAALKTLKETMTQSEESVREMRTILAGIPRYTTQYRKAARRALQAIDDFAQELTLTRDQIDNLTT